MKYPIINSKSSIINRLPLYICRGLSTNHLFLCKTNPILSAVGGLQMNVNLYNTTDYDIFLPLAGQKNKPNSNPNKPNLRKAKMNVNLYVIEDYRKKDDFLVRINKPNSNPISKTPKMNVNLYIIEDYENETAFRPKKTNPKQSQFPKSHALRTQRPCSAAGCFSASVVHRLRTSIFSV